MVSRYTKEFRDGAVDLVVKDGMTMVQVSKDLGINIWTLRDWVRARRALSKASGGCKPESIEDENRRLRQEISVLRQEREIPATSTQTTNCLSHIDGEISTVS